MAITDVPADMKLKKEQSLFELARMLRNGRQSPVNLVITKIRTKENFASLIGKKFETDSAEVMSFLNNKGHVTKVPAR
jgi:UPF0755 protein